MVTMIKLAIITLSLTIIGLALTSCDQSDLLSHGVTDSSVADADTVWIVSNHRSLYRVRRHEERKYESFSNQDINNVFFLDPNNGWVFTDDYEIWGTKDGGEEWSKLAALPVRTKGFGRQIIFRNENDGWILELQSIWHTNDGGRNWTLSNPNLQELTTRPEPLRLFLLGTEKCVVGMTKGVWVETDDGGENWNVFKAPFMGDVNTVSLSYAGLWIGSSSIGQAFVTADSGRTWHQAFARQNEDIAGVRWISFADQNLGWAAVRVVNDDPSVDTTALLRTIDGGSNWHTVDSTFDNESIEKIVFMNSENGFLFSKNSIYSSNDGGKKWRLFSHVKK